MSDETVSGVSVPALRGGPHRHRPTDAIVKGCGFVPHSTRTPALPAPVSARGIGSVRFEIDASIFFPLPAPRSPLPAPRSLIPDPRPLVADLTATIPPMP